MRTCDSWNECKHRKHAFASHLDVKSIIRKCCWNSTQLNSFRSPPWKRCLIYAINLARPKSFKAARRLIIFKILQHSGKQKCVCLLTPWHGAKHFFTSKTLSWIFAYAHFMIEYVRSFYKWGPGFSNLHIFHLLQILNTLIIGTASSHDSNIPITALQTLTHTVHTVFLFL